jgi:hypothetical protein
MNAIKIDLAGVPLIVTYNIYRDADMRDWPKYISSVHIEIESATVDGGNGAEIDLDYPINRDTLGAHIDSIIFEMEETREREAEQ